MKKIPASDQSPDPARNNIIIRTAIICIISNLILSAAKISIGLHIPSVALLSEGINNAADSLSSVLTILGIKLSEKNIGRSFSRYAEGICSLIISLLILFAGLQFLKKSVLLISNPQHMHIPLYAIIIMSASAVYKIFLSKFTIKQGKSAKCTSLIAIGTECRNDFVISSITLISCVLFILFHISADAYAGIISSVFILKSDFGILMDSIKELKGK